MQLNHYTTNFNPQQFPITIICDNVTNAPNIGSLFRIADAFGVEKLVFSGNSSPISRKMTKTSRATEKIVNYEVCETISELISNLKQQEYQIIALEITSKSVPIDAYTFKKEQPIALIIGDENFGVSDSILEQCDAALHVTMFGKNSSMNVVQATNIALYEMTKQLR